MKDAIVTVVVAVVLALVFMYALMSWLFSGWGDRSVPSPSPPGIVPPSVGPSRLAEGARDREDRIVEEAGNSLNVVMQQLVPYDFGSFSRAITSRACPTAVERAASAGPWGWPASG